MKNTIRTAKEYKVCFSVGLELIEVDGYANWSLKGWSIKPILNSMQRSMKKVLDNAQFGIKQ